MEQQPQEGLASFAEKIRHEVAADVLDRNLHASDVAVRRGIAVESVKAIVEEAETSRKIRKEGKVAMPKRNVVGRKTMRRVRKPYKKRSGYKKHTWSPGDALYVARVWPDYKKIMKKFGVTKLAVKCVVDRLRAAGMKGLLPLNQYNDAGVVNPYSWAVKEAKRLKLRIGGKAFSRTTKS